MIIKKEISTLMLFFIGLMSFEFNLPKVMGVQSYFLVFGLCSFFIIYFQLRRVFSNSLCSDSKKTIFFYVCYLIFCLLSSLWSVNFIESVFHSLIYIIAFILAICMVDSTLENKIKAFLIVGFILVLSSWLTLVLNPDVAIQSKGIWRLKGIFAHEFELGFICSMSMIIILTLLVANKFNKNVLSIIFVVFVIFFITLILTKTRTLTAYTIFILCFIYISSIESRVKKLIVVNSMLLIFFALLIIIDLESLSRGDADLTLTGRTLTWKRSITAVEDFWLFGYGFASFNLPDFDYIWIGDYRPGHAHNAWVNSYFETGIIGMFLMTLLMIRMSFHSFKYMNKDISSRLGCYLILLGVFSSFTSLPFGGKVSLLSLLPLIFICKEDAYV